VLPPTWVLGVFLLLYGVLLAIALVDPGVWRHGRILQRHHMLPLWFLFIAAVGYGIFRGVAFNPARRPGYREWLQTTPWQHPQPLPLGPIHLVWQDLLLLGLLSPLVWLHAQAFAIGEPQAWVAFFWTLFLWVYLLTLTEILLAAGLKDGVYVIVFGYGLVIYLAGWPAVALAVAAIMYLWGYLALQKSLVRFDKWDPELLERFALIGSLEKSQEWSRRKIHGWPFDLIGPREYASLHGFRTRISYRDGVLTSLLAGWWTFVIVSVFVGFTEALLQLEQPLPVERALPYLTLLSIALAAGRIVRYCIVAGGGYVPPLNLWARLVRFRWIIPGYDQVFVAPICSVLVTWGTGQLLLWAGVPGEFALAACVTMMLLIVLNLGPSLERWHLTGNHRIAPGMALLHLSGEITKI
ncbi:MAG: hypothetical protein IH899_12945, partial [Planctomycetes bacterium]|nr:hypothetical protein [Planctomycetota bacterium]